MGIPQILMIVLISINLLLAAKDHGKPKEGNNNFWVAFLSAVIIIPILIWGGFFK